MAISDDIRRGEGYELEFKRIPNEDRVKYLKTAVAFANGKGGSILFGVANDGTVHGIDKQRVFAEVAVYDTRVEITSPGGLPRGLTVEKVLSGRSKIRNHALAEAFNYMNVIEQWGSGLRRVSEELAAYGAKPLQLEDGGIDVRVNVFRNAASADHADNRAANEGNCEINEVNEANHEVNTVNQHIVLVLSQNPKSTIPEMARICNISRATIDRAVKVL
jgi:predicted HTH transcriptional regulator